MLQMKEETKRCETNALVNCGAARPIYEAGNLRLCVFEMFREELKRTEDSYQIELLIDSVLFQSISIFDGI